MDVVSMILFYSSQLLRLRFVSHEAFGCKSMFSRIPLSFIFVDPAALVSMVCDNFHLTVEIILFDFRADFLTPSVALAG